MFRAGDEGQDTIHYSAYVTTSGQKPPTENTEVFNNGNSASQECNKDNSFVDTRGSLHMT